MSLLRIFSFKQRIFALFLLLLSATVFADGDADFKTLFPTRTAYVAVNLGGGSTEWSYLVDTTDPGNDACPGDPTCGTVPQSVNEGGVIWGMVLGFFVAKNFAIELQYIDFPNSQLTFSNKATYPQVTNCTETQGDGNGTCTMSTKTDAYSLSGKFLIQVGQTHVRAFAAVGAGLVQRSDVINQTSAVTPYMSSGLDYNLSRNWVLEGGFQYFTGFGASEMTPANDFVPFAWDAYGRVAYQF